jgi:hypothetical protein
MLEKINIKFQQYTRAENLYYFLEHLNDVNHKVVDLTESYNFDIKNIFI